MDRLLILLRKFESTFSHHKGRVLFFGLSFIFLICYLLNVSVYKEFYYDSYWYWNLGNSFAQNGSFDLLNYTETLRGLIYPLFNYCLIRIANSLGMDQIVLFKIFSAFYVSFLINILIPSFVEKAFDIKFKIWQVVILNIVVFFFWRGYYNFPLTDFISIFVFLLALYLWMLPKNALTIISGVAFAFAINIRPIFLIAVLLFLGMVLVELFSSKALRLRKSGKIILLSLGLIIGSLPQMYVNYFNNNTISPLVQTSKNSKIDLFLQQLKWGIYYQKYEANAGFDYPVANVIFFSKEGLNLYKKENGDNINNYSDYFKLLQNYPLVLSTLYFKHLFNGLDITYPTPYIIEINNRSFLISFINYTLLFIFILILIKYFMYKDLSIRKWYLILILLSPSLLAIPTAIEVRFFLPIHLFIYIVIILGLNVEVYKFYLRNKKTVIIVSLVYLFFLLVCFTLSINTFSNLEHPLPLTS